MPVSIPAEVVLALFAALAVVVLVAVTEALVFARAARATPLKAADIGLIVAGLAAGLVHSAAEWIAPYIGPQTLLIVVAIAAGVLALTAFFIAKPARRRPLTVALLGAGLLYQFAWVGGRYVLPAVPVLGDALAAARCERDTYCTPERARGTGTAQVRIDAPAEVTSASGEVECVVDERPIAGIMVRLSGSLRVTGASDTITFEGVLSRDDDPSTAQETNSSVYIEGPIGGFDSVRGEASRPRFAPADPNAPSVWRSGTITIPGLRMERLQPAPEFDGNLMWRHEPALDAASGTLTWSCD